MKTKTTQNNIPDGWQETKLASIGTFSKGSGISKEQLSETGHNAIRYGELYTKHHFHIKKIYSFISDEIVPLTKKIEFGDILFAGSGETIDEIGKSAAYLLKEPAYAGGDTIIFRPKNANSLFLSYFLNVGEARKKLRELGQGQSVVHIYKSDIENVRLHLPPLPEQNRIVAVLETWDKAIETLTKKVEVKKEMKKGLMQQLLTGAIRCSGFTEPWKTHPLSFFVVYIPRPIQKPQTQFTAIGIRSHCKGTFRKENFEPNSIDMDTLYELRENDLVVNITFAWEGAIAIVDKDSSDGLVSHRFPTYTFKDKIGSPEYFKQFIQSKNFRYQLKIISPGGAGRNRVLSKKDFVKLKIKIPDYKEQCAIGKILTTADKEITELESKLALITDQKNHLLNNLITGTIRTPEKLLTHN